MSASVSRGGSTEALDGFLQSAHKHLTDSPWNGSDSDADALGLVLASFAHAWGVVVLSRTDLVLHLPAAAAARSAWESALIASWLLQDDDPIVRTLRWLGYKERSARHAETMAEEFRTRPQETVTAEHQADAVKVFKTEAKRLRDAVGETLKANPGIGDPIAVPAAEVMAVNLGRETQYRFYRELSTVVHGQDRVLRHVREHLDSGECSISFRSQETDWALPLAVGGYAVWMGCTSAAARAGDVQFQREVMAPAWDGFRAAHAGLTGTPPP